MTEYLIYASAFCLVLAIAGAIEQASRPKDKGNVIDFTSYRRADDWYEDGRIKW